MVLPRRIEAWMISRSRSAGATRRTAFAPVRLGSNEWSPPKLLIREGECAARVVGERFFGVELVLADLDLDGAVAPGGAHGLLLLERVPLAGVCQYAAGKHC